MQVILAQDRTSGKPRRRARQEVAGARRSWTGGLGA
jgi:hypothetical protein